MGLVDDPWSGQFAGVDQLLGDVAEFGVAVLGGADQELEGAVGVESVAFHQDADGFADVTAE